MTRTTLDTRLAQIFASEATASPTKPTAATVLAAAHRVAHKGYYGSPFIFDVAEELGMPVAELGPVLLELNRSGELRICRMDLVPSLSEPDRKRCLAGEVQLVLGGRAYGTFHRIDLEYTPR